MSDAIPAAMARREVPAHYRQFKSVHSLEYLAHRGAGPLFKIISGEAWYQRADIETWLNSDKTRGGDGQPAPRKIGRGRRTKRAGKGG